MHRHFGIGTIDARLVEAGLGDAGLQIVGNDHRRHTAIKAKGACVRADPVGQRLREGCLGVRKTRCAECGDEQLAGMHLSGRGIDDVNRRAGVIDKQLLAGHMGLPHRRRQPAFPGPIKFAEPAAAVTVGMRGTIFFPDQLQRHALATQLPVDRRPVRQRPPILGRGRRDRIEAPLQCGVVKIVRQRPTDAGFARPAQARSGGGRANPETGGNLALGQAGGRQPQHVADLAHG